MSVSLGQRPAIVVGAGPVGLTAALALHARGVTPTVLEAGAADRARPGSRAIFTHRATLETFERISPGLGFQMAERGLVWPTKRTLFRGRQVYARTYPPLPRGALPPLTSLPQAESERVLLDAVKAAGLEVAWDAPVARVETTAHEARVTTEDGTQWAADYVLGADGAGSVVRSQIGASLEGERCDAWFVVVDVAEHPSGPLPPERVFHYRHPAVGGRNVLHVPFQGGWRVDLQCRPDDNVESFSSAQGVRTWLSSVMPAAYVDRISWVSTYQFRQVVADRFADPRRRVLLVGEAAHQFPPFGARGMNSGVADAEAAAAAVQQAHGAIEPVARHAIDRFERERVDAAQWNREAAARALAHMEARDPLTKAQRWLAAGLSPVSTRAGKWLDTAPYGPPLRHPRSAGSF